MADYQDLLDAEKRNKEQVQTIQPVPSVTPRKQEAARTLERENATTRDSVFAKTRESEVATIKQRKIAKSQGFSLYEDQLEYLQTRKALMQLEKKKIDVIEMIREAVDAYIALLKKKEISKTR